MKNSIIQILFYIVSISGWYFIGKELILMKRAYYLIFLFIFPLLMGLFGGFEYLSACTLMNNMIFLLISLIMGIKNNKGKIYVLLFFLALLFFFGMTLFFRELKSNSSVYIIPFWSVLDGIKTGNYGRIGHFINNVVLFIPFGLFTCMMTGRKKNVVISGTLFSCTIELTQFIFRMGECDIDDLLGNAFGTILGILLCMMFGGKTKRS